MTKAKNHKIKVISILSLIFFMFSILNPLTGIITVGAEGNISFYVSPTGNDNNDGSLDQPFKTIEKARDIIRTMNLNMDADIDVYLRGGDYNLSDSLVFNNPDSGTNGHYITYKNYPGEKPVISGAHNITGWSEENGVYKTNVGQLKFRDLYVNGQRATRARTESYKIKNWDTANQLVNVESSVDSVLSGQDITKVEMFVLQHWVLSQVRLAAYTIAGTTASIEMETDAKTRIFNTIYPDKAANQSIHFENAKSFMDKPGEWYLDETNGDLFYIPLSGQGIGSIDAKIGTIETLVKFVGADKNNTVKNIMMRGLTFEYTKYQYPIDNNGVIPGQGAVVNGNRQPAAIFMQAADNIKLERNVIRHTGAAAIDIKYMAHNNEIIGNTLLDIAGNGIQEGLFYESGGSTTDTLLFVQNDKFKNNYLKEIGVNSNGAGILCGYTNGVQIENNTITNVSYTGISVGWGWTSNKSALGNVKVSRNNIYNVMNKLTDGAAIYTLSKTPNSEISKNYIHDIDRNEFASNYSAATIYLDQNTSGYNVFDNVQNRVGQKFMLNMIQAEANTLINNDTQDQSVIDNAGLEPAYRDIVPEAIIHNSNSDWVAPERGSIKISGTVSLNAEGNSLAASILKNGTTVWTQAVASITGTAYDKNIDLEPGDIISFIAMDGETPANNAVAWNSLIVEETYPPRLAITAVTFPEQLENTVADMDYLNCRVTVKAKPGSDLTKLSLNITTPPGTVLSPTAGIALDYTNTVTYRVYMEEGSKYTGFAGERKYKDWKIKVIPEQEGSNVKGYNFGTQIADANNWYVSGGTKVAGTNSLTLNGGYAIYQGKQFQDELLEFYMKTTDTGWPSITFRNQSSTADGIGASSSCYIVVVKPNGIELQRFNAGVRTVFYGNVGGSPSKYGDAVPNTMFDFTKDNLVQLGALNTEDGVKLQMFINGKKVFDCIDNFDGKITNAGYFGTHEDSNTIKFSKTPVIATLNAQIEDTANWYVSGGTKAAGVGRLTLNGGYAIYQGKTFKDEMLEFNMDTGNQNWPSITFRNQSTIADGIGLSSSCYIVVVKPSGIELQRFNAGVRTVFYGTVGGSPSKFGDAIPNTVFNFGQDNLVQLGTLDTDDGVRLIMNVNGKKVFDCIDTFDGKITGGGYFGTHQDANVITFKNAPEIISFNGQIEDQSNWYVSGGTKTAGTSSLTLNGGYGIYQGKQFQDGLLEFNMKTTDTGWPSITLRNQSSTADGIGPNSSCYIVVVKPSGIELQRFNAGVRTVFYGNVGGSPSKYGDAVPNTMFDFTKDNLVQLGALNTDEGVKLIMNINGKKVFDCIDTFDGKITNAGYFGTHEDSNSIKFSKNFVSNNASGGEDKKAMLLLEINRANTALAAAQIGNGVGQYPLWAKEYLEKSIIDAQNCYVNENATGNDYDVARNNLLIGESAFAKALNVLPNVALGKEVTSSENGEVLAGFEPACVVDGATGYTNGWSAESAVWDPGAIAPWIQIDLGSETVINRVEIVDRPTETFDGERKNFQIQASNDPTFAAGTYTILGSVGATAFTDDTTWVLNVTDMNRYRYIRYAKTEILYAFISEFRVFGVVAPQKYTVGGIITDGTQVPVTGAAVNLYSFDNQTTLLGSAVTAANGTYTIATMQESGKYIVKADKAGYGTTSATVYIPFTNVNSANITMLGKTNIALNKPVTTSDGTNINDSFPPSKAVDGIGLVSTNGWDCKTSLTMAGAWLQIDLQSTYVVNSVEIDDRPDPGWDGTRKNIEIRASNDPTFVTYEVLGGTGNTAFPANSTWVLNVTNVNAFRYIRYVKTTQLYAFLSEIRVFGKSDTTAPAWPQGSQITTSGLNETGVTLTWPAATDDTAVENYRIYNGSELVATVAGNVYSYAVTGLTKGTAYTFSVQAGDISGCWSTKGLSKTVITLAPVNIALNKPVTSSDGTDINTSFPPSKAVDGIGLVSTNGWDCKSSLTMAGAWLQIDLQNTYVINNVEIDDRPDAGWDGTRKYIEIRGSNDPTFVSYDVLGGTGSTAFPYNTTWALNVTQKNAYRYIRYVKTAQLYAFLSEIRVFGTPQVDTTTPVTYATTDKTQNNGWYNSDVTVTLSGSDDLSGVQKTECSFDKGTTWNTYTAPVVISAEGMNFIQYRSVDNAGNIEATKSLELQIDKSVPEFVLKANGVAVVTGSSFVDSEYISFEVSSSDELSGVNLTTISVDGVLYIAGTQLDYASKLGTHNVEVTVSDKAENSKTVTFTFCVNTSINSMTKLVGCYYTSGDLDSKTEEQLKKFLSDSQSQYDKGNQAEAVKFMEIFIKQLEIAKKNWFISDKAVGVLANDANEMIRLWSKTN